MVYTMHPRKLWACAEPRRVAARCGEAPLVCCTRDYFFPAIRSNLAHAIVYRIGHAHDLMVGCGMKDGDPFVWGAALEEFGVPLPYYALLTNQRCGVVLWLPKRRTYKST